MTEKEKKQTKEYIEAWEREKDEALKENDIMRAIGCRLLANQLRKDIGEEEL